MNYAKKAIALLAASVSLAALPSLAQAQASAQGHPFSIGSPKVVEFSKLAIAGARPTDKIIPALSRFSASQLAALKAQAAAMRGPQSSTTLPGGGPALPSSSGIKTVVPPDISFDGDFQNETNCGDLTPADQALAIGDGANPVLQSVNLCLSVFSPGGARLSGPVTLRSFFSVPATSTIISDPRALYDWYNHRFIVTMLDSDGTANSYYDVAVSKTDSATGAWWVYRFHTPVGNNVLNDYPRVGQDHTATYPIAAGPTAYPGAIYLASNLFAMNGSCCGAYVAEEWLILGKAQLYNGLVATSYAFENLKNPDGSTAFTSQPANVWNPYDAPRSEFFVESEAPSKLVIWSVSNPFGYATSGGPTPELSSVAVTTANSFSVPPGAVQNGGAATIDTGDTRISGEATYNAGYLHAALTSANGTGGAKSIIYKVRPILNINDGLRCTGAFLNACPQITSATIQDESVLNFGTTTSAFYATPQPNTEGNVTTVFNYSASNAFASLAYIQQRVTQGAGFVDTGSILQAGSAYYTQGRWGDYTAVAPAGVGYTPTFVSNTGVGFSGMYAVPGNCFAVGGGCWKTRIGYVQFSDPTQP